MRIAPASTPKGDAFAVGLSPIARERVYVGVLRGGELYLHSFRVILLVRVDAGAPRRHGAEDWRADGDERMLISPGPPHQVEEVPFQSQIISR